MRATCTCHSFRTKFKSVLLFNSSMNGFMERFFMTNGTYRASRIGGKFSICIVDEASQCVEPEMLIPFPLGFTKLVMIGDPEQLPGYFNIQHS